MVGKMIPKTIQSWMLLMVCWPPAAVTAAVRSVTCEDIVSTWHDRQERMSQVHVSWTQERTYTKFWANCHVPRAREAYVTLRIGESRLVLSGDRLRFDSGTVDSSGDTIEFDGSRHVDELGRVQHNDARRVFRNNRLRYDQGRRRVDPRDPAPVDWPRNLRAFTTVFDGEQNTQFLPAERGQYPEVYVFADSSNRFHRSLYYLPFILTLRAGWLNIDPDSCWIKEKRELIGDRECCVMVESGGGRQFWVDVERNCLVLKYVENWDGLGARMKNQFDIDYAQDTTGQWLPVAWSTVFLDNHGLMEHYARSIVVSADFEQPIAGDEFHVRSPVGTWTFDEATGEHTLTVAAGTVRRISEQDLHNGLTYNGLMGASFEPRLLAALTVTVVLLLTVTYFWRRRRVDKQESCSVDQLANV